MNKIQLIALLKSNGMEVATNASDETVMNMLAEFIAQAAQLPANAAPQNISDLQTEAQSITAQLATARKEVITRDVQACIDERRIPASMKDKAIARVLADASYLEELRSMPTKGEE